MPRLPLLDHLHKGLSQRIEFLEDGIGLAEALDERPLVYREPLLVCDKQPGGLPGGQTARGGCSRLTFLAAHSLRWPR